MKNRVAILQIKKRDIVNSDLYRNHIYFLFSAFNRFFWNGFYSVPILFKTLKHNLFAKKIFSCTAKCIWHCMCHFMWPCMWHCTCQWSVFPRLQEYIFASTPHEKISSCLQNLIQSKIKCKNLLETLHKKMKFSIKDFFSKCDRIRRKLRIWSHLLKKCLMENFIFYAVRG